MLQLKSFGIWSPYLALSLLAAVIGVGRGIAQIPTGFGTTPTFDEEFNETALNTSIWSYRGEGTQRNACYIDSSAVSVANGFARISIYTANNSQGVETNYCGAITTQNGSFLQTYGYWEANVRYQYQPGMQCSFWVQSPTIGSTINNPQQSGVEMDVFEHTSANTTTTGYDHAVHWNGYSTYHRSVGHNGTLGNLNDGNFHRFGLAWTPGNLTFYVDGQQTWSLKASDAAISNIAEYIILDTELPNAAVVPSGGYGPLGSSTNAHLDVDYVRVYPYSTNTTSTTLSPIADAYVQDGSNADTNFGGSAILVTKKDATGYNRNSYLMFDLSQITGTVLQATLYLTSTSQGENNITNYANYVASNNWTESGITWNNQPSSTTTMSTGLSYAANMLANFDASSYAASGQRFSVEIAPDTPTGSNAWIDYASQENGTTNSRPQLVIISSTP